MRASRLPRADRRGAERPRWVRRTLVVTAIAIVIAAVVGYVLLAIGVEFRGRVPVAEAELVSDTRIRLAVRTCGGEPVVDRLAESVDAVEVALVSTRRFGGSGMDCLDSLDVQLVDPLGDRQLRDLATGRVVDVNRP